MNTNQAPVGNPGRPPHAKQFKPTQAEVRELFRSLKKSDSPMDRLALSNLLLADELRLTRLGK